MGTAAVHGRAGVQDEGAGAGAGIGRGLKVGRWMNNAVADRDDTIGCPRTVALAYLELARGSDRGQGASSRTGAANGPLGRCLDRDVVFGGATAGVPLGDRLLRMGTRLDLAWGQSYVAMSCEPEPMANGKDDPSQTSLIREGPDE